MSDYHRRTRLSRLFDGVSNAIYSVALNNHRRELVRTKPGSEERFLVVQRIGTNLTRLERALTWVAHRVSKIAFWLEKEITKEAADRIGASYEAQTKEK